MHILLYLYLSVLLTGIVRVFRIFSNFLLSFAVLRVDVDVSEIMILLGCVFKSFYKDCFNLNALPTKLFSYFKCCVIKCMFNFSLYILVIYIHKIKVSQEANYRHLSFIQIFYLK